MSVNTLIQNTIHGSCAIDCGCALCIPNTIDRLESPQITIDDRISVIDDTQDGLNQIAIVDELVRNAGSLEALWHSLEAKTNIDPVFISIATNALQTPYTAFTRIPSVESFTNDYNTALEVSIESIGEMLTKVWEAIKSFIANIYRKVMDFIGKIFGMNSKLKAKADSNRKEILLLEHDKVNEKLSTTPVVRTPITSIKLHSTAVKYLAMMTNKHYVIADDLVNEVNRYAHFYKEGFSAYVALQRVTCEQVLANNKLFIKNAEEELARGTKRDDRIADTLVSKARRRSGETQVNHNAAIERIRSKTAGSYIGGLFVNNTPNPKEGTEIFDYRNVETTEHDLPLLPLNTLNTLNEAADRLRIMHGDLMDGEFSNMKALTDEITETVSGMVKTLKTDYSDYPALIRAFNANLVGLQQHYNTLLNRLYRVVKHTSELTTVILNDVVPAMIVAHENNQHLK